MFVSMPSLDEYMATLGAQSLHPDPTLESEEGLLIKAAAAELRSLDDISQESLAGWIRTRHKYVEVLGLAVGLSREKLLNNLKYALGTSGYLTLARDKPSELIEYLDDTFGLIPLLHGQIHRTYDFGDVLVARAGTRALAKRASDAGRSLEDEIEEFPRHWVFRMS
ncbi:hypothetical protein ACIPYU_09520 [Paenarthrobacter nicotinovorans]|uniref:hypothetical protein n=1 Tax=Paenarthrobacter nicotinovorans TaxID=29320 RepID=UPI00381CD3C3